MKELVEYIVTSLVDDPEAVQVTEERRGDSVLLRVKVADGETGKIIGRQGRIIQAIRALVKVAAVREGVRADLQLDRPAQVTTQD
jgi:predicted RNA-binding protein YlqC (UPF0109 family)